MCPLNRLAVVREFGGPENIRIEQHPLPELGAAEVRVAVRIGGLNPVDARRRSGAFGGSVPLTLGSEFAGVVLDSTDPQYSPGDEVIGWGVDAADADVVDADASRLYRKPASMEWEVAGGIGGVGHTALTALAAVRAQPGDTVLVHGAGGAVGTVLAQLAHARSVRVIGTAGEHNQERLRALGVLPVVYGPGVAARVKAAAAGQPIAASIDLAGTHEAGEMSVEISRAGGRAVTLVPETLHSHGLELVQSRRSAAQMHELMTALIEGSLVLPVEAIPFTDIVRAHRRLDAKHSSGKVVLENGDNPFLRLSGTA